MEEVGTWDGEVGTSKGVSGSTRKGEDWSRIQLCMSGEIVWMRHLNSIVAVAYIEFSNIGVVKFVDATLKLNCCSFIQTDCS